MCSLDWYVQADDLTVATSGLQKQRRCYIVPSITWFIKQWLRKYVDTYKKHIIMRHETNDQIIWWSMLQLHCILKLWITHAHTHTRPYSHEHATFFSRVWRQTVRDWGFRLPSMVSSALVKKMGAAHMSSSFTVRLLPPAPAWSSRRKDVERAPQHRTDHHCQNGRGCVALGREKKAAHLQIYMPRVYAHMLTHTHTHTDHAHFPNTHDKLVVSTHFETNSHTHTQWGKSSWTILSLPPMQFCVGHQAHHHAILHYFLLIFSSLIFSHFCLMCCPVTTNSPHTT